jgi:hypothetical protein
MVVNELDRRSQNASLRAWPTQVENGLYTTGSVAYWSSLINRSANKPSPLVVKNGLFLVERWGVFCDAPRDTIGGDTLLVSSATIIR